MQSIPIISAPAQNFSIVLGGQSCQINLYSLQTPGDILGTVTSTELQGYPALYADLLLGTQPIISCRIVRNLVPWLLDATYQGFIGDLVMIDTLADTDPVWTGLGAQYQLVYLSAADLAAGTAP